MNQVKYQGKGGHTFITTLNQARGCKKIAKISCKINEHFFMKIYIAEFRARA